MMTYDTLVSAVVDAWEGEGDTYLQTYIPRAIDLAEESLTRRLDSYGMVVYPTLSINAGDFLVSVPSSIRVLKSVTHVSAGRTAELFLRADEYIRQYWPIRTSVGVPKYYAKRGYTSIYLAPTPGNDSALEFSGCARPEALTSVNQSNWFSQYASRALFYATMVEVARWGKSVSAESRWKAALDEEIAMLTEEDRRNRRDDQEPATAPNFGDNMLRGGA